MSRIGRAPIAIPAGVTVTVSDDNIVTVKGPKGELSQEINKNITVKVEGNVINVTRPNDEKQNRAFHGLYRSLIANMVTGVSTGFTKTLNLVGTGYRAEAKGTTLNITIGYSRQFPGKTDVVILHSAFQMCPVAFIENRPGFPTAIAHDFGIRLHIRNSEL